MDAEPHSPRAAQYRYRFGTAEFDEACLELRVEGRTVEIQRRPLEVLAVLLRHAGEVVTREELQEAVWNNRVTVDNVVDTALTKLRGGLGTDNAALIRTQPRVGFRLVGPVERVVVGRHFPGTLTLEAGMPVPRRENFFLVHRLGAPTRHDVWLARHAKTHEFRVYKFCADGEGLAGLKREATLSRVLRESLGEREDFVRILDWNFEEPPFFLECEYAGESLLEWAAGQLGNASLEERLALFIQAVDAIAAAHSVGVLHKDLKPANLLVTRGAEALRLRVTDFGSARLLEPERLAALGITQLGMTLAQAVVTDPGAATLLYLAPETICGGTATVKSDVYALGILLYQLVVGNLRTPLVPGWERNVSDEILREDIAAATDGDPAVRLGSAAEFAERLRRLNERRNERSRQRAIERQMRTDREALRQAHARRPWLIATITVLCLGLLGVLVLYGRVRVAQRLLSRQYAVARALNNFLTNDFIADANPNLTGRTDVTVVHATREAASKIDTVFKDAGPEVRGGLHEAMQKAFAGLSDFPASIAEGRRALAAFETAHPPDWRRIAEVRIRLALIMAKSSKLAAAAAQLHAADKAINAAQPPDPALRAQYWWAHASVDFYRLALPTALKDYERAWALAQRASRLPPGVRNEIQYSYADILRTSGDFAAAERQARSLLVRERAQLGASHPQTCFTAALLASILGYRNHERDGLGMARQAGACLQKSLGPANIRTISAYQVMADLQFQSGLYVGAAETYTKVAAMSARVVGPQALRTLSARENAGVARQHAGQTRQADAALTATLAVARTGLGWTHPTTEDLRYHLADCRLDEHRTTGVARMLSGLSSSVLNEGEIEADWAARLAYQEGRLQLYTGHARRAISLLRTAAKEIAEKDPAGPISVTGIDNLIHVAFVAGSAARTIPAQADH